MNKFELVTQVISKNPGFDQFRPRLLDVGCRGCELKPYVEKIADYEGVDLFQNPEGSVDHVLDVSNGLPFADRSFDYVVALDLVEHLDDFEGAITELLRVSKKGIVIMLPNMGYPIFRIKYLLTGRLGAKYDLIYGQGQDRHRWVTKLTQSDEYMRRFAVDKSLAFKVVWFNDSRKKKLMANFGKLLGLPAELWAVASLYTLMREDKP